MNVSIVRISDILSREFVLLKFLSLLLEVLL